MVTISINAAAFAAIKATLPRDRRLRLALNLSPPPRSRCYAWLHNRSAVSESHRDGQDGGLHGRTLRPPQWFFRLGPDSRATNKP